MKIPLKVLVHPGQRGLGATGLGPEHKAQFDQHVHNNITTTKRTLGSTTNPLLGNDRTIQCLLWLGSTKDFIQNWGAGPPPQPHLKGTFFYEIMFHHLEPPTLLELGPTLQGTLQLLANSQALMLTWVGSTIGYWPHPPPHPPTKKGHLCKPLVDVGNLYPHFFLFSRYSKHLVWVYKLVSTQFLSFE